MKVSDINVSQRPPDYKFVQQKLPASHPVLTVGSILPTLFVLSFIFIGLGIGMWHFVNGIPEETILYSDCMSDQYPEYTCEAIISGDEIPSLENRTRECSCQKDFQLEKDMKGTVYMYYALTNYYQNHLRYSLSRDPNQLKGNIFTKDGSLKTPSTSCGKCHEDLDDLEEDEISHACVKEGNVVKYIFPCGLQASTMFNDVLDLTHVKNEEGVEGSKVVNEDREVIQVPLSKTGISWESDKEDKFRHPERFNNIKDRIWRNVTKPHGWKTTLWGLDPHNFSNNGLQNEEFINWMRTAAFPNFRKLYRILNTTTDPYFKDGLPAGNYTLNIQYNFAVPKFKENEAAGEKYIILTTTRMTAARNYFLASAFIVNGIILLVVACLFLFIHVKMCISRKSEYKFD